MTAGPWTLRNRASDRQAQPAFLGTVSALWAVSTTVTMAWSSRMSGMADMPMPGGWTMSMAWMRMPDHSWGASAASWLGMWVVMMTSMMLPSLVPMLCRYRDLLTGDADDRRGRLTAIVGAAYFSVWTAIRIVVFGVGTSLAAAAMSFETLSRSVPTATAAIVLIAGTTRFCQWKAHHLASCRQLERRAASFSADVHTAWRYGFRLGVHCSLSSAGLTAILLVMGVMDLRVMALVAAAITIERLAPAGERIARIIGLIIIGIGVGLLARAAEIL
jgi:predicted metal-binding membrane protein